MYSECIFTDQRWSVHTLCNDLGDEAQLGPRSAEECEAHSNKVNRGVAVALKTDVRLVLDL